LRVYTDSWDKGYVSANGTWIVEEGVRESLAGERTDSTEIKCFRNWQTCFAATAKVLWGSWKIPGGDMLFPSLDLFEIARWDEREIVTKPDTTQPCGHVSIRIGRHDKAVTMLFKNAEGKEGVGCFREYRARLGNGPRIF
jgi:hypothetical protein